MKHVIATAAIVLGMFGAGALGNAPAVAASISPTSTPFAATVGPGSCTVTGATITWGFKESFRAYINSSIANGTWTVADGATYTTPNFGFSRGTGTLAGGRGTVSFPGSIEFSGHGGILDTTVANPALRFDGSRSATLLLDVKGTTQQGAPIDEKHVEFATIDLSHADAGAGHFALDAAAVTLTSAGATAFGTYPRGAALDPITASFAVPEACVPRDSRAAWALPAAIGGGVLLLAALAVLVVHALRTRRHP